MGLESGTKIDDLVTTNPTATDGLAQGDDHLRLIKVVLKSLRSATDFGAAVWAAGMSQLGFPATLGSGNAGKALVVKSDGTGFELGGPYAGADPAVSAHLVRIDNPHSVTKTQVGLQWVTNDAQVAKALGTTKGDIAVWAGDQSPDRLPVGSDGQILTANSAANLGISWTTPASIAGTYLKSIQTFTGSATWTKPTGITRVLIVCLGGGGGGGGGTVNNAGGGGGSGARSEKLLDVTAISSRSVTIGGGGSSSPGGSGTAGGDTSFGSDCVAKGGSGGSQLGKGGAGGSLTGAIGDVKISGFTGGTGDYHASSGLPGTGGGPGGGSGAVGVGGDSATGNSGGGGAGGSNNQSGGSGASGYCIVYEFGA